MQTIKKYSLIYVKSLLPGLLIVVPCIFLFDLQILYWTLFVVLFPLINFSVLMPIIQKNNQHRVSKIIGENERVVFHAGAYLINHFYFMHPGKLIFTQERILFNDGSTFKRSITEIPISSITEFEVSKPILGFQKIIFKTLTHRFIFATELSEEVKNSLIKLHTPFVSEKYHINQPIIDNYYFF